MQERQEQKGFVAEIKAANSWYMVLQLLIGLPLTAYLRRDHGGKHFANIAGFFSVPMLILWAHEARSNGLLFFTYGYLALLVYHRTRRARQLARGKWEHSHFWGYPVATRWLFGRWALGKGEFLTCLGAAYLALYFEDPGLASYLFVGGLALLMRVADVRIRERRQVELMRDAMREQEYLSDRMG